MTISELFGHAPSYGKHKIDLLCGNVLDVLRTLPDESIQCVCTSPPYFRLRRYSDAVKFKDGIPEETRIKVMKELEDLGVVPIDKA